MKNWAYIIIGGIQKYITETVISMTKTIQYYL